MKSIFIAIVTTVQTKPLESFTSHFSVSREGVGVVGVSDAVVGVGDPVVRAGVVGACGVVPFVVRLSFVGVGIVTLMFSVAFRTSENYNSFDIQNSVIEDLKWMHMNEYIYYYTCNTDNTILQRRNSEAFSLSINK